MKKYNEPSKYPYLETDLRDHEGPSDTLTHSLNERLLVMIEREYFKPFSHMHLINMIGNGWRKNVKTR